MPSAVSDPPQNGVTKLTNCRLVRGDALVPGDLWISAATGKIIHSQSSFYDELLIPSNVIDLGGRIVSPGLIDVQLNGAYGFNFSTMPEDPAEYARQVREVNRQLVRTGVTAYMPTLTSQKPELYQTVRGKTHQPRAGCRVSGILCANGTLRPSPSSGPTATSNRPRTAPSRSARTSRAPSSAPARTARTTRKSSGKRPPSRTSRSATGART